MKILIIALILPFWVGAQSWQPVGNAGFIVENTHHTDIAFNPSTGEPYAVFASNSGISVMRYDGLTWVAVGIPFFSPNNPFKNGIAFNSVTNRPYVVFREDNSGDYIYVYEFDGTNWVNISGFSGITGGDEGDYPSLATHPSTGEPYVAMVNSDQDMLEVRHYDGANWIQLDTIHTPPNADECVLRFHPVTEEPYVAYRQGVFGKINIQRFDGSAWVFVGPPDFSPEVNELDFQIDPVSNELVVAFYDRDVHLASAMRYDGTAWQFVGNQGFSGPSPRDISLGIHPSSQHLLVAYRENTVGPIYAATYDGLNWVNTGNPEVSSGLGAYCNIAFHPSSNVPHIIFQDNTANGPTVVKLAGFLSAEVIKDASFNVYPNPSSGTFEIDYSEHNGKIISVDVFDLLGKSVYHSETLEPRLVMAGLKSGSYIIQLQTEKGSIWKAILIN